MHKNLTKLFFANLHRIRRDRNETLETLSNVLGKSRQHLRTMEKSNDIKLSLMELIAKHYEKDICFFFQDMVNVDAYEIKASSPLSAEKIKHLTEMIVMKDGIIVMKDGIIEMHKKANENLEINLQGLKNQLNEQKRE